MPRKGKMLDTKYLETTGWFMMLSVWFLSIKC